MKFTLVFIGILTFIAVKSNCATKEYDFGFFKGVVESRIETDSNDEMSLKAEQAIRRVVEKHLGNKKKNRAQKFETKREVQEIKATKENKDASVQKSQEVPNSINWDEHQETRDLINKKVTGGTQAINDLIGLLKEREEQNDKATN
ncbi:hypothetical protein ACKWTF_011928 [Chironomus riparius]